MAEEGLRYSAGKPEVQWMPPNALLYLGKVYGFGAIKYAERNWEKGMKWTDMIGPAERHFLKFKAGEDIDPSGIHHLAHTAFSILSLLEYWLTDTGEDNRTKLKVSEDKMDIFLSDDWVRVAYKEKEEALKKEEELSFIKTKGLDI